MCGANIEHKKADARYPLSHSNASRLVISMKT